MPLIDDRGRLFGKFNLIDAIVGVIVLLLIPLAYGAYALFRVPVPQIIDVQPSRVTVHTAPTVTVTGRDLRPFLRAFVGTVEAKAFLVQSPSLSEVKLPDLEPGTYDLSLFDEGHELVTKRGAITVTAALPPPKDALQLQIDGLFIGLSAENASLVRAGLRFFAGDNATPDPIATVVAVRPAEAGTRPVMVDGSASIFMPVAGEVQVPVIVRITCAMVGDICHVAGANVLSGASLMLPVSSGASFRLFIRTVRPANAPPVF